MAAVDRIRKKINEAIAHYNLITDDDRVLVAVSGGKDSTILALMLAGMKLRWRRRFSMAAVMLDQGQPGFAPEAYLAWMVEQGVPVTVLKEDTYSIVKAETPAGKAYCSLCSRMRRGILYTYARKHGFTKIALGHHRDDLNQTFLMNLFQSGQTASMPPILYADDEQNTVIRPLCLVAEEDLLQYSALLQIPVIPCRLCGSQQTSRQKVKVLLEDLRQTFPDIDQSLLAAQKNLRPAQLADPKWWYLDSSKLDLPKLGAQNLKNASRRSDSWL